MHVRRFPVDRTLDVHRGFAHSAVTHVPYCATSSTAPTPPAAAVVKVVRQTDVMNNGQLRTPTRIPQKVEMIREEEAPPPMTSGVVGGVPGGIPGGQLGGVIGGSSARVQPLPPFRSWSR
jgi:hypothetical protein